MRRVAAVEQLSMKRSMTNAFPALLGMIVLLEAVSFGSAQTQPPGVVGLWRVEFALSGSGARHLQFEAYASGKGSFLLLDPRSSLVPPAERTKARWSLTAAGRVNFAGEVEFPIGNVGRQAGVLTFDGSFDSEDSISGEVSFVDSAAGGQKQDGKFTATRIRPPTVRLLTLNSGERLSRGSSARLEWEVQAASPIVSQQIFLSEDRGATFRAISETLAGDERSYTWEIATTLNKTKKALIKIVVTDEQGNTGEDLTDRAFRIR